MMRSAFIGTSAGSFNQGRVKGAGSARGKMHRNITKVTRLFRNGKVGKEACEGNDPTYSRRRNMWATRPANQWIVPTVD